MRQEGIVANLTFHVAAERLYITTSTGTFVMEATSGKGACMSNPGCSEKPWIGPIPQGLYYAYGHELSDRPFLWDLARTLVYRTDFGDWRIPLHRSVGGGARDGFFIHCGRFRGSAGCIDVGGGLIGSEKTDWLKQILQSSTRSEVCVQ